MREFKKHADRQFAVLGLGGFGESIARALAERGYDVLVVDEDPDLIHKATAYATVAVQGDLTDEADMAALGLSNFEVVIIAIGRDFESAILGCMIAKENGAKFVVAKARGFRQKQILESVGVDRVVLPEIEMGQRVASDLVDSNILDFIDISEDYSIAEIKPNPSWVGKTIADSKIRERAHLNIVAVKHEGEISVSPSAQYIIEEDDILVVIGENQAISNNVSEN